MHGIKRCINNSHKKKEIGWMMNKVEKVFLLIVWGKAVIVNINILCTIISPCFLHLVNVWFRPKDALFLKISLS